MVFSDMHFIFEDTKASESGTKGANFSNSVLDKASLSGNFINANFTSVHAHEVNAAKARFKGATMKDADFSFSILPGLESRLSAEQKKEAKLLGVKFV